MRHFKAADSRHGIVGYYNVMQLRLKQNQCFLRAAGGVDAIAAIGQKPFRQEAGLITIIDQENGSVWRPGIEGGGHIINSISPTLEEVLQGNEGLELRSEARFECASA